MSLSVGGYNPGYTHPGPMGVSSPHTDFYQAQYPAPVHMYPDYNDRSYFHNWVLSGTPDLSLSPEGQYGHTPVPPPVDMLAHVQFESYTNQFGERCVKRKVNASKKERRRTQSLNNAFSQLRDCIPNVPSDTKLSKIKTLRLAISYISYLMDILSKDDPKLTEKGFKAEISRKRERHTIDLKTLQEMEKRREDTEKENKKDKRTGWPEQVWASELKQSE